MRDVQEYRLKWAANIKAQRQLREWSMAELARRVGVTTTAVSYWESADRAPRDDQKLAIADVFGMPVDLLFPLFNSPRRENVA